MVKTNKTDSVRTYLKEIGQIKILTADQEISLARQIQDLLKLEASRTILKTKLDREPTELEWARATEISVQQLKHRLYKGRTAKNQMIQANLRLVVSVAKKYINRGLSLLDLIQEGSLGLIRATEKFDPEKGYKFSTYAMWWIKQGCTRAIADRSRTIRLPIHVWDKLNKIKKTTKTLYQSLGRWPTELEISEASSIPVKQLKFLATATAATDSIDRKIGKDEDTTIVELLSDPSVSLDTELVKDFMSEDLQTALSTLTPREAEVMRLRYGLDDGKAKTLQEIGNLFQCTRERVRQVESKALYKLRKPNRLIHLKDYLL
ncbi:MAG: RNA polymerase sigma factor, RpoD/SigA family [Prochloraceae cyanobacterium]